MSNWRARTSTASLVGACVFAVVSGAGSVFVGNWWGQHHAPVVVQYVGPSGSASARASHAGEALPGGHPARSQPDTTTGRVTGQDDAARARSTAASRHQAATAPQPAAKKIRPADPATPAASTAPSAQPSSGDATAPATAPPTSPAGPGSTDGSAGGGNGNGQ